MSLDQPGSVPVDTHMLNIARRYLPHLATQKTITGKVHKEVGEHFRSLLGPWAGKELNVKFDVLQLIVLLPQDGRTLSYSLQT